ncbi:biotin-protein ligase [Powellomyces hirtus]|nr:biotin-protein ligase [Powellomyces hirtus]
MNVLVYTGPGTSRGPIEHTLATLRSLLSTHYDIIPVDAHTLLTEPWAPTTSLLVIPGGRDVPYVEQLQPEGTRIVDEYVKGGGSYLGICAGAYFAARNVEFEMEREEYRVVGQRALRFYPGTAKGSVVEGFVYESEKGAKAVPVKRDPGFVEELETDNEEELCLYVNGGPWFVPTTADDATPSYTNVRTLAWYADAQYPPRPAIVECNVGAGRAILSGPHFEYNLSNTTATTPTDPNLATIAPALVKADAARLRLARGILKRLGLKLNTADAENRMRREMLDPGITPMYLCLDKPAARGVEELIERMGGVGKEIADSVDVFRFVRAGEPIPPTIPREDIPPTDSADPRKPTPITIITHPPDTFPPPTTTPHFSIPHYFSILNSTSSLKSKFGSTLLYAHTVSSTQTLLDKNLAFSASLPRTGFVCTATHQAAGRGRGRNSWISQQGCLMFSATVMHEYPPTAVFVQYLVAVAVIHAIKTIKLCENLPVKLKWPNDIYAHHNGQWKKIGGVLVTSSYEHNAFKMVLGCGLNVSNPHPTLSLSDLLQRKEGEEAVLRTEEVLARIMTTFGDLYEEFERARSFEPFLERYYQAWLHSDQQVQLLDIPTTPHARIIGIDGSGLLRAVTIEPDGGPGEEHLLQPDGNSFDMMKGLISRKK